MRLCFVKFTANSDAPFHRKAKKEKCHLTGKTMTVSVLGHFSKLGSFSSTHTKKERKTSASVQSMAAYSVMPEQKFSRSQSSTETVTLR